MQDFNLDESHLNALLDVYRASVEERGGILEAC
jgi:hypothetical protein